MRGLRPHGACVDVSRNFGPDLVLFRHSETGCRRDRRVNLRHARRALAMELGSPARLRARAVDRAKAHVRITLRATHARLSCIRRRQSHTLRARPVQSDERVRSELRRQGVSLVAAVRGGNDDGPAQHLRVGRMALALACHRSLEMGPLDGVVGTREPRLAVLDGAFMARRRLSCVFVFDRVVASALEAHL